MKNIKKLLAIALAVAMCLCLASCSMVDEDDTKITNDNIKIGVIIPGKTELDDGEVNDLTSVTTINAINNVASLDYGIASDRFHYQEDVDPTDAEGFKNAMTTLLNLECTLIFLTDDGYAQYVAEYASDEDNTEVQFMVAGEQGDNALENVHYFDYSTSEADYLAGIVASLKATELNSTIGYIVADTSNMNSANAFDAGAKSVNSNVVITKTVATDNVVDDATSLIKSGSMVIASDFYSEDIDNVADANNAFFCGYGTDTYTDADYEGNSTMLCSTMIDLTQFYVNTIKAIVDQGAPTDFVGNYANGTIYISTLNTAVANGTAEAVANVETSLSNGTLSVSAR